jgi:hypothetical protein
LQVIAPDCWIADEVGDSSSKARPLTGGAKAAARAEGIAPGIDEKFVLELFGPEMPPDTELEKNEADCAADEPLFVEPVDKNEALAALNKAAAKIMVNNVD